MTGGDSADANGADKVVIPFDIDTDITGGTTDSELAARDRRIADLERQMAEMRSMLEAGQRQQSQQPQPPADEEPEEDEEQSEGEPHDEEWEPEPGDMQELREQQARRLLEDRQIAEESERQQQQQRRRNRTPMPHTEEEEEEDDEEPEQEEPQKPPGRDARKDYYHDPVLPKGKKYDRQRKRLRRHEPVTFDELQDNESRRRFPGRGEPQPADDPRGRGDALAPYGQRVPEGQEPGGRWTTGGHSNLLTTYGTGHDPRRHYPRKQPMFYLPPVHSGAPFTVSEYGSDSPFGVGKQHILERGSGQSRVNRRGALRDFSSKTATVGIAPASLAQRVRDLERGHRDQHSSIRDVRSMYDKVTTKVTNAITSPQSFASNAVEDKLLHMIMGFGPKGAAIVAAITAIAAAPKTAELIIQALSKKGLPLNADWHRTIEAEVNALFDIDEKKRRLLGQDAYVVTQTDRYEPGSGATTYNSFQNRHEIIISESIGLAEKAVGITY